MAKDKEARKASVRLWKLGAAAVAAQGVTFGFARYGYGLFLPEIRGEFRFSAALAGVISSATYVSYLLSLVVVGALAARTGPRVLVVAGGLTATGGMALVTFADSPAVLAVGLILAGLSPGFVWSPYSDAVDRLVPEHQRQRVMGLIPTGTAIAVAVAGPAAVLADGSRWRYAWGGFAVCALVVTVANALVLPSGPHRPAGSTGHQRVGMRWLARRPALPLYVTAFSYGLVGAFYWTFAVDAVSRGDGADGSSGPLFWTLMGLAGIAGVFTGSLTARAGLRRTQVLLLSTLAVAIALLGVAADAVPAVAASALLYGPAFIAGSGLLAVWSYQVFPELPATGFSAAVFFLGIGTVIGPAALGAFADASGLGAAFLLTSGICLCTLLARPADEHPRARPPREGRRTEGVPAGSRRSA